ncbi:hypothetical protein K7432_009682 [Basidiobolus ranarum]|uniref:Uncharacterized protein n=1 Tax=Basidiobolus ranarum TaxID=34480 RepID=A0ABR2WPV3_9FUNG
MKIDMQLMFMLMFTISVAYHTVDAAINSISYGQFQAKVGVALSGSNPECVDILANTLRRVEETGKAGVTRIRASQQCGDQPVWVGYNVKSQNPTNISPGIVKSLGVIFTDLVRNGGVKHAIYNIYYDDKPIGGYWYKIGGSLPLQYFDMEYSNNTAKDSRSVNSLVELPISVSYNNTNCNLVSLDTTMAADVVITGNSVQSPELVTGERETAYKVPNIQGYEIIVVASSKKEGMQMADTSFVRTITGIMAKNEFSNVEYQCGDIFVEVTALAYQMS